MCVAAHEAALAARDPDGAWLPLISVATDSPILDNWVRTVSCTRSRLHVFSLTSPSRICRGSALFRGCLTLTCVSITEREGRRGAGGARLAQRVLPVHSDHGRADGQDPQRERQWIGDRRQHGVQGVCNGAGAVMLYCGLTSQTHEGTSSAPRRPLYIASHQTQWHSAQMWCRDHGEASADYHDTCRSSSLLR